GRLADGWDQLVDRRCAQRRLWLDGQPVHTKMRVAPRDIEVDRHGWRDRDLELAEPGWPLLAACSLAEVGQRLGGLVDVELPSIPAVPGSDRTAVRGRRVPADHNRRMRQLHPPGPLDGGPRRSETARE